MEAEELRGVFAEEWSSATADAALRDDEDADELAATGQILAATYVTEAAGPCSHMQSSRLCKVRLPE